MYYNAYILFFLIFLQQEGRLLGGYKAVEEFVVDYEAALWNDIRHVFEGAEVRGCAFHWGQAVWRQIQVGLRMEWTDYNSKFVSPTYK